MDFDELGAATTGDLAREGQATLALAAGGRWSGAFPSACAALNIKKSMDDLLLRSEASDPLGGKQHA